MKLCDRLNLLIYGVLTYCLLISSIAESNSSYITAKEHINTSINIGIPLGNPPLLYIDPETEKLTGLEFKIQEILFTDTGLTPRIKPYENVIRLAAEINKGSVDAGPMLHTDALSLLQTKELSCTQNPYGSNIAFLYTLEDNTIKPTDNIAELYHFHIAFTRIIDIYRYLPDFPKTQISSHPSAEAALKMLTSGRSQLLLSTPYNVMYWRKRHNLEFKRIYQVGDYQVHLCFSNTSLGEENAKRYAHAVNKNIPKLKEFFDTLKKAQLAR